MAQSDPAAYTCTVVLLKNVPPISKNTDEQTRQKALIPFGYHTGGLTNIMSVNCVVGEGMKSGAVYKLYGRIDVTGIKSVKLLYHMTMSNPVMIELSTSITKAYSNAKDGYRHLTFKETGGHKAIISGLFESVEAFCDYLNEQGAELLLSNPIDQETVKDLPAQAKAVKSLTTPPQSVYDSMSPDALALLEQLPRGQIEGVYYDSRAGRVLIDNETPEKEDERITKFQTAYQFITNKKLKIASVPVPANAPPDAVAGVVKQYVNSYDQCAFLVQDSCVKIVSISTRQHDQAKTLLGDDLIKVCPEIVHISDGRTLTLKQANIVDEKVDMIVNPANSFLKHGGGVAKALNEASGGVLQEYSDQLIQKKKQVMVGKAVATPGGGNLKCKFVIHAVGPTNAQNQAECERLLNSVVTEVLKGAEKQKATSVSFPAISTGIFGVKKELVARCLVDTIVAYNFTKPAPVLSDIRIVIIDDKTYAPFAHYFHQKQATLEISKGSHKPVKKEPPTSTASNPSPALPAADDEEHHLLTQALQDIVLSPKDSVGIRSLLKSVAKDWKTLGSLLGFSSDILDEMVAISAKQKDYLNKVITNWLSGDADSPTVSRLVYALHKMEGTESIVQSILSEYGNSMVNSLNPNGQNNPNPIENSSKILYPDLSEMGTDSTTTGTTVETSHSTPDPLMNQTSIATTSAQTSTQKSVSPAAVKTPLVPVPSSAVAVHTPHTTVSSPQPELQGQSPLFSTLTGYNSGQPYRYPTSSKQAIQFPSNENGHLNQPLDANHPQFQTRVKTESGSKQTPPTTYAHVANPQHGHVSSTDSAVPPPPGLEYLNSDTTGGTGGYGYENPVTSQPQSASQAPKGNSQSHTDKEQCPICIADITSAIKTKCGHVFCSACLKSWLVQSSFCPICQTPLRAIVGKQPPGGTMSTQVLNSCLPGHESCATIEILYTIPSGIQTQEHPNPGQPYEGTTRVAYLPYNTEGVEVLNLFLKAFNARLIFTIGRSVTTGRDNVAVWNDIHHKTSTSGGAYGYPDPGYLQRVKADLAAKSIVLDGARNYI